VDIILVRDCFWLRTYRFGNQSTGSLNCPKRKPLSCFNPRILKVDEIKVTVVTRSDERFFLSENKGLVGTAILREAYSNADAVSVAQPVDCENFCGNGGHWCFLLQLMQEMRSVLEARDPAGLIEIYNLLFSSSYLH